MSLTPRIVHKSYVAVLRDGKVLMTQDTQGYPGWKFPGGHVEDGETSEVAAVREIKEEVGLDIQLGKIFFEQEFIPPNREDELHRRKFFIAFSDDGRPEPRPGEVKLAQWFSISELAAMPVDDMYAVQQEAIVTFLRAVSA